MLYVVLQFAALVVELNPVFSAVVDEYVKAKQDAVAAAALRKKRKQDREDNKIREAEKKALADQLAVEQEQERLRLEQQQQEAANAFDTALKAKYSNGLFSAHQHRFVTVPPNFSLASISINLSAAAAPPSAHATADTDTRDVQRISHDNSALSITEFCPICVEKRYDLWVESFLAAEKQWASTFDVELQDHLRRLEAVVVEEIEAEYEEYLYSTAEETNFFKRKRAHEKERKKKDQLQKKNLRSAFVAKPKENTDTTAGIAAQGISTAVNNTNTTDNTNNLSALASQRQLDSGSISSDGDISATRTAGPASASEAAKPAATPDVLPTPSAAIQTGKKASKKGQSTRSEENVLTEPLTADLLEEILATNPTLLTSGPTFTAALQTTGFCALPPRIPMSHVMLANRLNTPHPFLMSGLSIFTPDGRCLIPEPEPEPEPDEEIGSVSLKSSEDDNGEDGNPPLGIRVRVWSLDDDSMIKGAFLGQIKIGFEVSCALSLEC